MNQQLGIVIIGRNEGERLKRSLKSVPGDKSAVVYVDSGSTDDSVEFANTTNAIVHELDPVKPFSAARARREGVSVLIKSYPNVKWIQFLDGDCELEIGWLDRAINYLVINKDVGIVCGLLKEKFPDRSIYNRLSEFQWNTSIGEITACGGIFMIPLSVYESIGGFNRALLTGEESELCSRVIASSHRIVRIDMVMARHDTNVLHFSDWWKRAIWGGYGDALERDVLEGKVAKHRRQATRSSFIWGLGVPIFSLLGLLGMFWSTEFVVLPILAVTGYLTILVKISLDRIRKGDSINDAVVYSVFCILRKIPNSIGFLLYKFKNCFQASPPDPHAASPLSKRIKRT